MAANTELFEWTGHGEKVHPGLSLGQFVLDHLRRHVADADFPAQIDAATGSELSFSQFLELSVRAAEGWRALGVETGMTVTVFARNSEMLYPAVMGCVFQGVAISGVAPSSTEGELRHCLSLLQPKVLVCDPSNASLAARVAADTLSTECSILVQNVTAETALEPTWGTLQDVFEVARGSVDVATYHPAEVGDFREHVAAIVCSSGTTGLPKGVMISNYGMLMGVLDSERAFSCVCGERMLTTSPMSWVTALGILMGASTAGTTRVVDAFTTPAAILTSLQRYKVNCWFTAPPLLLMVVEAARSQSLSTGEPPCPSLRAVVAGGTALPAASDEAAGRTMHCEILQAYALTETLIISSSCQPLRPGTTGNLVPGVRVRIVDPDTGRDIRSHGQPGEMRVITPSIMKGYKDNAEATAATFDQHGYFCTGDLACFDQDGYLSIVGRLKDLLKYKGDMVAPAEVEAVLRDHPSVADVCVVGRPHPVLGDVPSACVVRRPGFEVDEGELLQLVADRLSDNKRLRGGVVFVQQIPKTANGKVARQNVVSLFDNLPMYDLE